MGRLCKSMATSFSLPNRSLSCSIGGGRSKRQKMECSHPMIVEGKCLLCKRAVDDKHSLPFGFLRPSLRLSHEHADLMRGVNTRAALRLRKLHLVLDLDHTLLHSAPVSSLCPVELERLKCESVCVACGGDGGGGDLFLVGLETEIEASRVSITKLRPHVREFLREAHEMFELTVYTRGSRVYSSRMTKLLDPDGKYFGDRVIAREDCRLEGRKSLDVVLAEETSIIILDDSKTVWRHHAGNLMRIQPYYYFYYGSEKRGVLPRCIHNEDENDKGLVTALRVLKAIHRRFFETELGLKGGDVRELMRQVRIGVLDISCDQASPGNAA